MYRSFFEKILAVIFPDACVGCGVSGTFLCSACLDKIPSASQPEESFIASIYSYKDFRVRRLVKLLKYQKARRAAQIFAPAVAALLTEFLGEEGLFLGTNVLLVPVPLSKKRHAERGYNQSELIARATLALLPQATTTAAAIALDVELLEKVIDTVPQVGVKRRSERLQNLGECFRVSAERSSSGQVVVLLDDVTTTGATLIAARHALIRAGFRHVFAVTVAH